MQGSEEVVLTGEGLDRIAVIGLIYDRLAAAGIEVRIRLPLKDHCIRGYL